MAVAAVALLVDVLWLTVGLGPLAILLAAPFIWGVRWTTGQFADQNRTREWLVRAMHAALDERDPGAGRRSARIARWAAAIAEEAGRMFAAYDEEQLRFILDFMGGAVEFLERHRARVRELGAV